MPHISGKQAIIKEIDHAICTRFMLDLFNNDEFNELMNYRLTALECRTISPRMPIPKNKAMMDMLWQWGEAEYSSGNQNNLTFFQMFGMTN